MTTQTQPTVAALAYQAVTAAAAFAAVVNAAPTTLGEFDCSNTSATPVYFKLYNQRTVPNPATDVPMITVPVAAGAFVATNFGTLAKRFPIGLAVAVTAGVASTDTAAVAAGIQLSATYI